MRNGISLRLLAVASGCILMALSAAGAVPEGRVGAFTVLELDGVVVGYVDALQVSTPDTGFLVDKAGLVRDVANLHASEITFQIGADMSKPMYDWIKASMDRAGTGGRKDGAIIYADFNHKELSRIEFQNALVAEVQMPALDGASAAAAKMTVTIRPESTSRSFAHAKSSIDARKQKAWLCSNFRVELGRAGFPGTALGCTSPPMISPALDQPTMQHGSLVFDSHEIQAFVDWQQALYCSGLPQESNELSCTVSYLDSDGATLFTVTCGHMGIEKLTPNVDPAGALVSYTVQLYMAGDMNFSASPPTP